MIPHSLIYEHGPRMGDWPSRGYRWYEDFQDEMFVARMGSENMWSEVLQNAFLWEGKD